MQRLSGELIGILSVGVALAGLIVGLAVLMLNGQDRLHGRMDGLDSRMGALEQRMARLEGLLQGAGVLPMAEGK